MDKIKKLQEQLKKGEITKAKYLVELEKLLEGKEIEQDDYDEASTFDPDAGKPIYTQEDVDRMIVKKATQLVRKHLKDAGVEIDADNKTLLTKVVDLVKVGTGKAKLPEGEEVEALKKKAVRADTLAADVKSLRLENALLKTIGKHNPVSLNPVIALIKSEYIGDVDIDDDTGEVDIQSLNRVMKRVKTDEPSLFKAADNEEDVNNDDNKFRGKGPNGGTGGTNKDTAKKLEEAKNLIDVIPKQTK